MTTIRIFLASSNELADDRKAFEQNLGRLNNRWHSKEIYFKLVHWEDHYDHMSRTRTQDEYNKSLAECEILVVLFWKKVGKYTREEFETGYQRFISSNQPKIFIYQKTAQYSGTTRQEDDSRHDFEDRVQETGYFSVPYANSAELVNHFTTQLTDLYDGGSAATAQPTQPAAAIPHAFTPPPFLAEIFLGRETELAAIKEKLFTDEPLLLLVNGEGGIGKTSLAAQYYHRYRNEYTHTAWVLSEKNIAEALLLLAPALGVGFNEQMDTNQRLQVLLQALDQLQKPCLLIIDNVNEPEDLANNYHWLRSCGNFHILLTSRITQFEQTAYYRIEGLPEQKALELFRQYYPKLKLEEEMLFYQIYTAVGANTLVLEILAKNLALLNKLKENYSLSTLLEELQQKGVLALTQTVPVGTTYHSSQFRHEKPEAIIGAMYDLGELIREEVALLSVFAVLPAERITFTMLETLLPSTKNLENNLIQLSQKGWIEWNDQNNSFKCNPVIQEITKAKAQELMDDCATLINTLKKKLKSQPSTGHLLNSSYAEAAIFSRFAESALDTIDTPNYSLGGVAQYTGRYYQTMGNLPKALYWFEKQKNIFEHFHNIDPDNSTCKNNLAISYQFLGNTQISLGKLEQALIYYQKYNQLEKELYEAYPDNVTFKDGLAISYQYLGNIQIALGNLTEVLDHYYEHNKLEKELHEVYPDDAGFKNGLAISHQHLGNIQKELGNLEEALSHYHKYNQLEKELYEVYPENVDFKNNLAVSFQCLGNIQRVLNNLEEALGHYQEYNQLEKELHEAFPNNVDLKNNLAVSCTKLGIFYRDNQPGITIIYFSQAHQLWKELTEDCPHHAEFQNNFEWVKEQLATLEQE